MLPACFNKNGILEPGTYKLTYDELRVSLLIEGDGSSDSWDKQWRLHLLNQSEILVNQLWAVGIEDIFLDGSFVENKDHPNDIDGYFDPHLSLHNPDDIRKFEKIISDLNSLDQHKIWNWDPRSRKKYPGFAKAQLPMWLFYRVEFYPHLNQGTGITDQFGNDLKFPSALRQSRNKFEPKGIIQIIKRRNP